MAGHSKWANIKHKKERADKKKGKLFSRIAKEIISAAKQGSDPKTNAKLRLAIQKAKDNNVPNENIARNIKKASDKNQANYFETTYEIYGHGGVGIIVDVMTDNKNRVSSEIRVALNRCGGSQANLGAVSFNFDRRGIIQVERDRARDDEIFELSDQLGALDFDVADDLYIVVTKPNDLFRIKMGLEGKGAVVKETSLEMIPKNLIECSLEDEEANKRLIARLEDIEDVDALFHNMG